jgi:hypothetical protein
MYIMLDDSAVALYLSRRGGNSPPPEGAATMARYRENFRRPPNPKTKAEHDAWIRAAERGGQSYEDHLPASILWEAKLGEILHLAPARTEIVRRGHAVRVVNTVIRGHYGPPSLTPAERAKHSRSLTPAVRRRAKALHQSYIAGPPSLDG